MHKLIVDNIKKIMNIFSGYGIVRIFPIKVVFNLLIPALRTSFAFVGEHKMFLDKFDSLNLSIPGDYEPFETKIVKKMVKKGYTVLDIGANIGYYTLIFAKLVGKSGKVYTFEPDPSNFALLQRNIKINNYQNVILVNKAVSNKNGKGKLFLSEKNMGDHVIFDLYNGRKTIEIEIIKIDDYFKNYNGRIDFIKMDIQGAEGSTIEGMASVLKKNKNMIILTEFYPYGLKRFGIDAKNFLNLLLNYGFKLYNLNERKKKMESINISEFINRYNPEKKDYSNLLCIRRV